MISKDPTKIIFKGTTYWLSSKFFGGRHLMPLEQCNEVGQLKPQYAFSESFALLTTSNNILRHGEIIGTIDDIREDND